MLIIHLKEFPLSRTHPEYGPYSNCQGLCCEDFASLHTGLSKNEDQMDFMDENNLIKRLCSQMSIPQIVWVIINISDKMDKLYFTGIHCRKSQTVYRASKSKDPNIETVTSSLQKYRGLQIREAFSKVLKPTRPHAVNGMYKERTAEPQPSTSNGIQDVESENSGSKAALFAELMSLKLESDTPQNMGLIQIVKGCVVKILHHCILGCLKNEDQMDFMDENNLIKRLCSQMSIPQIVWVIINISDKMDKLYFTRDTLQEVTNCIQSIEKSKDPNNGGAV
ncbi:hypothetical protein E2320_002108 [Naja naja]|nr:hypothetical protein E2320_002108 [Naja naja]